MAVSTSERRPGFYGEINLAGGSSSTGVDDRNIYVVAPFLGTGTATDGAIASGPIAAFSEATTFYGSGSFGEYIVGQLLQTTGANRIPIYMAAVADPGGTAAQGAITFAGNASSNGSLRLRLGNALITVAITNAFTPTQSGDALVAAFNALDAETKPPFTASNAVGVVTFTATNTGSSAGVGAGGTGGFGFVVDYWDVGTQTATCDQPNMGGAVAGVGTPTYTTVLANLAAVRTHYLVTDCNDVANAADTTVAWVLRDHMISKSNEENMLGGVVMLADKGSLTESIAWGAAIDVNNCERVCIGSCEGSPKWEPCIAAAMAVRRAVESDVSRPVNATLLNTVVAPSPALRYTGTEQNTLMAGGITPLVAKDDVNVQVVRMISLRQDISDPLDITVIETLDLLRENLDNDFDDWMLNKKLKAAGEIAYNTNTTTTPEGIRQVILHRLYLMEQLDQLQGIDRVKDSVVVTQTQTGRVDCEIPAPVVAGLHVIASTINYTVLL